MSSHLGPIAALIAGILIIVGLTGLVGSNSIRLP